MQKLQQDEDVLNAHLATPHTLVVDCHRLEDGTWRRRAMYPEVPGCVSEGEDIWDVLGEADRLRADLIRASLCNDAPPSMDSAPLRWNLDVLRSRAAAE